MTLEYEVNETLDVKGLSCPMPVVKTRQAFDDIENGAILEVISTDKGSIPDILGWANSMDHVELVDQYETEEAGETLYKHYVQKAE